MGNSMLARLRAGEPASVAALFPKGSYRLHAMLTSAGYDRRTGGTYDWHGLRRGEAPFVLLQHTLSGSGRLRYEKQHMEMRAGQTLLLSFPHDNRYWLPQGESWEFFWLCLNGREVTRIWREVLARHGPLVCLSDTALERIAGLCAAALRQEATSPARASALAYAVAMALADDLLPWGDLRNDAKRPAAIERVISLCHANPVQPLDVPRMARAAGYSRHHFSRLFAAHEGMSPARYLTRLRMEEAARLLRADPAPIKEIARRSGFSDPNYFGKVFRRYFGIGPSDFRRSGMYPGPADPVARATAIRRQKSAPGKGGSTPDESD
jgi:AraC-like DNA-binding protein